MPILANFLPESDQVNEGADYGDGGVEAGNANDDGDDVDGENAARESRNEEIETQRRQAEFRESELSFLAVRTTCAKLLPVRIAVSFFSRTLSFSVITNLDLC